MALSTLRTNFSGLFKTKSPGIAETPQFYLKLTNSCLKQVEGMVASTYLKFHHGQCKYLSQKLKVAVRSAFSFFKPIESWYFKVASGEGRGRFLEIFKLLYALSKEVETFIQGCTKDSWIQSAVLLANVSEHIASLGFDLEFCTIVFSNRKKFGSLPTLTVAEISRLRSVEADIVDKTSSLDQLGLLRDVRAQLMQSKKSGSADLQQVTFLLERLKCLRANWTADSSESYQSSCLEISMSSLKQIQVLATGACGDVHKVNWLGMEVVRKTFHGPSAEYFEREVEILAGLCHPNIVSLLWYTRDVRKCYMIMELMDGDLYSLIQERLEGCGSGEHPFSFSETIDIILQVAEGMLFLHEKRIVHRDLKSRNILVNHTKATLMGIKYVHAKVADFGLSRIKEESMTYSNQTQNQGTTRWMAPEMMKVDGPGELQGEQVLNYPFKADVYSFGMVCFEILTGDVPYPTLTFKEVKTKVLGGERPQLPNHCPDRLRYLIEACWRSMPNERPSFYDICVELRDLKCAHYMTSTWILAPRCFSLEEIKKMTNDFSENNYIRTGGFTKVYKGVMVDTGEVVAVKRVRIDGSARSNYVDDEFRTIVTEVLPRLHHDNVVGFAGFCMEKGEKIFVFEYMLLNVSLEEWISEDARKVNMTWPVRRNICLGVANGIHYLHSLSQPRIVHRGIKPSNILLDQNLEPKVGGFDIVALLPDDEMYTQLNEVSGTWGYIAPEYRLYQKLSQKADVYSFGIVLLGIVSGRRGIDKEFKYLSEWH